MIMNQSMHFSAPTQKFINLLADYFWIHFTSFPTNKTWYHLFFFPKALFVNLKPAIRCIINHQEAWRTKTVDYIIFKTISEEN